MDDFVLYNCPRCKAEGVLLTADGKCPNCKLNLLDSDISRSHSITESKRGSISYNCWTCGTIMSLSGDKSDIRQSCPKCGTLNASPMIDLFEDDDSRDYCYYCQSIVQNRDIAVLVKAQKLIENPKYHCSKCNYDWQEATRAKGKAERRIYEPLCPICQSKNVTPSELPSVPVGKYYENFKNTGMFVVENDPFSFSYELRKLILSGTIKIPTCIRCKGVHKKIWRISIILAFLVSILALWIILFINDDYFKNKISEQMALILPFTVIWFIILFLSRSILYNTVGKGIRKESNIMSFPAVKKLKDDNWSCQPP